MRKRQQTQQRQNLTFSLALLAMLLGMGLAWSQLATQWSAGLPTAAAAQVADQYILQAELQRAIDAANSGRREPLTAEQQQQVLQRLIDEQLLLQYGLDLGLAKDNPTVRKPLVQAVMGLVRANATAEQPREETLRVWYEDNPEMFATAGQRHIRYYRVNQLQLNKQQLQANAEAARQALQLQGQFTDAQLQQWQLERVDYVPDSLLPVNKLRDYLGQSLVKAAFALTEPGVAEPQPLNNGVALLQVLALVNADSPNFDLLKDQVQRAWQRQHGEQALRALLEDLRNDYTVKLSTEWQ